MYIYDIVYTKSGRKYYLYVVSTTRYKDDKPPFISQKQYPACWESVWCSLAGDERVRFIKKKERRHD